MDFGGLRVISLESRRAELMEQLVRRFSGDAFVAPSVQEIPLSRNDEVFAWAERLFAGEFDMMVLMTGVGLTYLRDAVVEKYSQERFAEALRLLTIVSRGPKPVTVLNELGVKSKIVIPEPNTWKEIVPVIEARPERRITIQEYGRHNPEFAAELEKIGANVTTIAVYRWTLPDDVGPLREAVRRIAEREADVVIFTTSIQLVHLLEVAEQMGRARDVRQALREDLVVASVGPIMNTALAEEGIEPDIVPVHPKMGNLVRAAAEMAATALARKRRLPAH
ncbi:MAG TPA: uroporphyrinogen-III synthase [Bryobacteraceae bacterium]|jgi:uroporphyrinogen-III synthase